MSSKTIVPQTETKSELQVYTADQRDLVRRTICPDATDDELQLFLHQCSRTKLDPLTRQIYAVKRYAGGKERLTIQVSIDGFRLIAERTGRYAGQTPAMWCGEDGCWVDVWLKREPPAAAKVGIYRTDFREPVFAVALYEEYAQRNNQGQPIGLWARMPALMISKCAEALALRRAFPNELSGIYSSEEMDQADAPIRPTADEQLRANLACAIEAYLPNDANVIRAVCARVSHDDNVTGPADLSPAHVKLLYDHLTDPVRRERVLGYIGTLAGWSDDESDQSEEASA